MSTLSRWFIISYDFTKQAYDYGKENPKYLDSNLPREKMILFLIELGCSKIESYTDSTIHFKISIEDIDVFWEKLCDNILKAFPKIYFSINLIAVLKKQDKDKIYVKIRCEKDAKERLSFKTNFDNDVKTIIKKMREELSTKK
jgi:hypothetical protein